MKENKIKELQERLETLHVIQDARLACNADDLDIREEIAEVEEEIKELQDDTNVNRENSIKNERSSIKEDIRILESIIKINNDYLQGVENQTINQKEIKALEHILSYYKRVLKENEELKISNKEIDKECSRLEKKEVELINENEHYEDLIYALKTYYDITEEDLEKCMKNDR